MSLDELRRLHEQATPPPWDEDVRDYYDGMELCARAVFGPLGRIADMANNAPIGTPQGKRTDADLAIVPAARNALPALLALADAARAWRDAVQRGEGIAAAMVALIAALDALNG